MNTKTLIASSIFATSIALAIPHAVFADTVTIEAIETSQGKQTRTHRFEVELSTDGSTEVEWNSKSYHFDVNLHTPKRPGKSGKRLNYDIAVRGSQRTLKLESSVAASVGKRHVVGRVTEADGRTLELALKIRK